MDQLIIQKKEFRDQIQHIQDTINEAERVNRDNVVYVLLTHSFLLKGCEVASNIPVSEMIELTEKMKHLKNS